jgi:hypothetical protein
MASSTDSHAATLSANSRISPKSAAQLQEPATKLADAKELPPPVSADHQNSRDLTLNASSPELPRVSVMAVVTASKTLSSFAPHYFFSSCASHPFIL